jgi:hypothetical protein
MLLTRPEESGDVHPPASPSVLIIDDHHLFSTALRMALRTYGAPG